MKIKGLIFADLHIGAMNLTQQYREIENVLFASIKKYKPDFIISLGDFFDHKASLNDSLSYYSFLVFTKIISICEEIGINPKIRFVYGTESHEWKQYKIIETAKTNLDIKVIHYCEEEEIFPDFNVLYIPEEHIYSKSEYYEKYLSNTKRYDYIFGHGVIREVMKEAALSSDKDESKRKKVPVFSTGELMYACKGQTYFGHYHINTNMNNEVIYCGSLNRWIFGEEDPKGMYYIEKKNDEYNNEFIENEYAEIYKTIYFGYDSKIFKDMSLLNNKLSQIEDMIKDGVINKVRFEFNIPPDIDNPEYIIKVINDKYKFNQNVKVNIVNGYIDEKRKKDKEELDQWNIENAPLLDPNKSIEEKVSYFISVEYKRDITPEKIKIYLNSPLSEIIKNN